MGCIRKIEPKTDRSLYPVLLLLFETEIKQLNDIIKIIRIATDFVVKEMNLTSWYRF